MNEEIRNDINYHIELTQYILEILDSAKYISDGDIENRSYYETIVEQDFNGENIYILPQKKFNNLYSALQQLLKQQHRLRQYLEPPNT